MASFLLDSSALVKYYVNEPGSAWVRKFIDEVDENKGLRHTIFVAEITRVEVAASLAIMLRVGRIRKRDRDRAYQYFLNQLEQRYIMLSIEPGDYKTAADLTQQHPLKAYDAVQLAVALSQRQALQRIGFDMIFVSGDKTLLTAAQSEGLTTDNPFDHLSPLDQPPQN